MGKRLLRQAFVVAQGLKRGDCFTKLSYFQICTINFFDVSQESILISILIPSIIINSPTIAHNNFLVPVALTFFY